MDAIEKEAVEWELAEIIDHEVLHISKDKSHQSEFFDKSVDSVYQRNYNRLFSQGVHLEIE